MNNSQKTVYLIAVIAVALLIANGYFTTRIFNGYLLKNNALIALNSENGHGVSISKESNFVSLESGSVFTLEVGDIPYSEVSTISMAIPVENLKPNTTYRTSMALKLETNSPSPISIKSNSGITMEDVSFDGDINFKPIMITSGSPEYVIDLMFSTNDQGLGYIIFDFGVDESIDKLQVKMSNVIFNDFKEIENDKFNTEQSSEEIVEII
ncbi:hypothetical protein RZE82_08615 [Mollicutes bacterium LVI A0039]|nr:hypothetical protein RZE82_08615 [Mollicutes bacterium LVI A0039]